MGSVKVKVMLNDALQTITLGRIDTNKEDVSQRGTTGVRKFVFCAIYALKMVRMSRAGK